MERTTPITVSRQSSPEERETALRQIYYQALERQPYAYERKQLAKAEKDFLCNKIGVRRFLKELGHSSVYLDSFYYSSSNPKFIENCFKHFLGRTVQDTAEMQAYVNILMKRGVTHFINAILDSDEYRQNFGCFTVPYQRSPRCYESPKAYLETDIIRHELFGQRGWALPTLYWHQLGLSCEGGVCMYIEEDSDVQTATDMPPIAAAEPPQQDQLHDELMELLWGMDAAAG
ncbi:MAG: phycobilisome rod-core linker polypeptide [Synechococcales bacterium]|nr:phycobilisome rod-core linker polypeptide [Synechococcales bacterium]